MAQPLVRRSDFNEGDSIALLETWLPKGPWHLFSMIPDSPPSGVCFDASDAAKVLAWLRRLRETSNIYFSVNIPGTKRTRKARKEDVRFAVGLHADLDPRKGADLQEERDRLIKRIDTLPLPPSLVVDSGGGFQVFYKFENPIDLTQGDINVEQIENLNARLGAHLGGDHTGNIDRIMRLPGTINHPNRVKSKAGRKPAPAILLLRDSSAKYSIAELDNVLSSKTSPPIAPSTKRVDGGGITLANAKLAPWLESLIKAGRTKERTYPSRSEAVFAVACELVRMGVRDEDIVAVLVDPENGISESIREKGSQCAVFAMRQVERARACVAADFDRSRSGTPVPNSIKNVRIALSQLGIELRFNEFDGRSEIQGLEGFGPSLTDAGINRLYFQLQERFQLSPHFEWFGRAISDIAQANRFHPVRNYLQGLTWDGTNRVDTWLVDYLGVPDSAFARAVGRLVLIAGVRRVEQPGVKFDQMLVLEGDQGVGKTRALQIMARRPSWYIDHFPVGVEDSRRMIEATQGKWIVEEAELSGISRAGIEGLKASLSRTTDRARRAYGRIAEDVPRQFIPVGTTNEQKYLRDLTGNRRFWPVVVRKVDLAKLEKDADQLWAEARQLEVQGAPLELDPVLYREASVQQSARTVEDPRYEMLAEAVGGNDNIKITASQVWKLLDLQQGKQTQNDNTHVGRILLRLGFRRTRARHLGGHAYWYYRGDFKTARHWKSPM